ncbi:MAG TPA: hypothetical protein VG184_09605 [Acidimicrobiales bacterium]|jgi:hypothetical protein|nr:hypothetical protein [Acidimicrobiales bacterium]
MTATPDRAGTVPESTSRAVPADDAINAAMAEAADRLEAVAPGYLERVRQATGRLAVRARPAGVGGHEDATPDAPAHERRGADAGGPLDTGAGAARLALLAVEDAATIDVDVPVASRQRAAQPLKAGVKRLVGWYVSYLGQQVTVLGRSVTRLGAVLVERTEELDARTEAISGDVARLAERIERLEHPAR